MEREIDDIREKYNKCELVEKMKIERMVLPLLIMKSIIIDLFGDNWVIKGSMYIREREEKLNRDYWICMKDRGGISIEIYEKQLVDAINQSIPKEKIDKFKGLWLAERFNGLGYRIERIKINSPYLWSGTDMYSSGKYVEDGKYRGDVVDKQAGIAAVLKYVEICGVV